MRVASAPKKSLSVAREKCRCLWLQKIKDFLTVLEWNKTHIEIRRVAFKRSIGLTVKPNGQLFVSAPRTASTSTIQKFLFEHREWIEKNLNLVRELHERFPPKEFVEGEEFYFLGRRLRLQFLGDSSSGLKRIRVSVRGDRLSVEIPSLYRSRFFARTQHPEIAGVLRAFYKRIGCQLLQERVDFWSQRMDLRPKQLAFRSQKTRWGSCSSRGRVTLNWRLLIAPLETIDYVVVHELAHLRHYNHSSEFWRLVRLHVSQPDQHRLWLREHQYAADFLAVKSELHG